MELHYYIIGSSCLFFLPAIYGFYNELYYYSLFSIMTGMCSIMHWINPIINSWRRYLDLFMARYVFILYVTTGLIYIKKSEFFILGFIIIFLICFFYYCSCNNVHKPIWVVYHILFHTCVTFGKFLVLNNIIDIF
jgi:hypothetical protein